MFKKIFFVLVLVCLVSCNATKTPIRTTKSAPSSVRKPVVRNVRTRTDVKATRPAVAQRSTTRNNQNEVIESTSRTVVSNDVIGDYIYLYKNIAMNNMKVYGIPASIILAQGILESGAGRGDLAQTANNHFGIKCHAGWTGESVRHDDDASQECFRKYDDPGESFKDHALFLTGRGRYSTLFELDKDDYKAWAKGLRKAGYATDPRYPEKLITYIERYDLGQYDALVLGNKFVPTENRTVVRTVSNALAYDPNRTYHEVLKGDTLYSISKKYNVQVNDLKLKNNLSENTISIGQKLIVN
ncbi:flagellum-specific peptidoglycan hydrolase FlgJ [Flavobacterium sp. 7E]|uniref:glucosaminidase domain-containing protein n=1 Tax=unclassified Flavobacterium TaxID=196869 RepID=UPI00156DDAC2|nr:MULTISPECIES: glucosaminidase domain-containing protein [unclassified Flavobacterium]NRS90083.1 flagellum-specific peptidoglycan hydrolase FlgJ [Flavobacterium sp. 7E]NRT13723.1 flagellum-specific peptidoglycan hydrolase FlgJ [Flavobacterium sp. 28A]